MMHGTTNNNNGDRRLKKNGSGSGGGSSRGKRGTSRGKGGGGDLATTPTATATANQPPSPLHHLPQVPQQPQQHQEPQGQEERGQGRQGHGGQEPQPLLPPYLAEILAERYALQKQCATILEENAKLKIEIRRLHYELYQKDGGPPPPVAAAATATATATVLPWYTIARANENTVTLCSNLNGLCQPFYNLDRDSLCPQSIEALVDKLTSGPQGGDSGALLHEKMIAGTQIWRHDGVDQMVVYRLDPDDGTGHLIVRTFRGCVFRIPRENLVGLLNDLLAFIRGSSSSSSRDTTNGTTSSTKA